MSDFDAFLRQCWNLNRPANHGRRAISMVDIALSDDPIDIMPLGPYGDPIEWNAPVPVEPPVPIAVEEAPATAALPAVEARLQKASKRAPPSEEDAAKRSSALGSWCDILEELKSATSIFLELKGDICPEKIELYFASKRTGTLAVRACAWRLFLHWARAEGHDPEELSEALVFT